MALQTTTQQAPTVTNGVNVSALYDTIDAVKQNPEIADFRFRASNRWIGADHNRTTISGFRGACGEHDHAKGPFVMDNAEPPVLLGEGAAANPVEYVLHALAGWIPTSVTGQLPPNQSRPPLVRLHRQGTSPPVRRDQDILVGLVG